MLNYENRSVLWALSHLLTGQQKQSPDSGMICSRECTRCFYNVQCGSSYLTAPRLVIRTDVLTISDLQTDQ